MSHEVFSGRRVLVLEDEPVIAMLVEELLEDAGASVIPVGTLAQAEAAVNREVPDLAILDINIHNETSYGLARVLTGLGVPVVFASGYGEGSHPEDIRDVPTVAKPYDLAQIAAAFDRLIEGWSVAPGTGRPHV